MFDNIFDSPYKIDAIVIPVNYFEIHKSIISEEFIKRYPKEKAFFELVDLHLTGELITVRSDDGILFIFFPVAYERDGEIHKDTVSNSTRNLIEYLKDDPNIKTLCIPTIANILSTHSCKIDFYDILETEFYRAKIRDYKIDYVYRNIKIIISSDPPKPEN